MSGPVPAIHVPLCFRDVNARDKPGAESMAATTPLRYGRTDSRAEKRLFPYLPEESLVGLLKQSIRFLKPAFVNSCACPLVCGCPPTKPKYGGFS